MRRAIGLAVVQVSVLGALLSPALAHPGFRPSSIPAGEPTEIDLVIEHDCEAGGGGVSPTRSVAVQVPEAIAIAEALPEAGWETASETDDDGRTTVVTWSATEERPATPPTLRLRLTPATQTSSTRLELRVLQECDEGSYLWGGARDDEPPVVLTVTPGVLPETSPSPTPDTTPSTAPPAPTTPANPDPPLATVSDAPSPTDSDSAGNDDVRLPIILASVVTIAGLTAIVARRRRG